MSRRQPSLPARVVLVDKPAGWTSYDVIRRVKQSVRGKIGHAGTLDPFATGLLVVLLGQATRVSSLIMELPKEYLATARFGATSTTGDPTGEVSETGGTVQASELLAALDGLRGPQRQRVPMTSAVKVGGERLYDKARRGEEIETPEREIMVYDTALVAFDPHEQTAEILFRTGKGAYIRKLADDLGAGLGVGAYLTGLRRRLTGIFAVDDALSPEEFSGEILLGRSPAVRPLSAALSYLPALEVQGAAAARAANGNELRPSPEGRLRVMSADGLLAFYQGEDGVGRPQIVFPEPQE